MKYIKLFEEKVITRTAELKQFCNDNLAYLMDNNFNFVIKVGRDAQIKIDSQAKIIYPMRRLYDTIVIKKFKRGSDILTGSDIFTESFNFSEFSDDLVPFILYLGEKYGIKSIFYLDENHRVKWPAISREEYNDIDNIDLSSLDDIKIRNLVITIKK